MRALLLLAFGCVVAIGLAEAALRTLRAVVRPAVYELDDVLGWRLTQSLDRRLQDETGRELHFVTDTNGCRVGAAGSPTAAGGPATAGGVLFVGDSFTMGAQVQYEELFSTRVATDLGAVPCRNAGVGGYSTVQQLLQLDTLLPTHRPDVVVLVVYENDFVDNLMPYFSGLGPRPHAVARGDDITLVRAPDPLPFLRFVQPAPAAMWLYRHSALYQSIHKNVFLPAHAAELGALENRERDAIPVTAQHRAMHWALRAAHERVRRAGATLAVCALPTREMAAGSETAPNHAWLAARCDELAVPFLSLLDALRTDGGADNYFPVDIHFNAQGHASAARAMLPFVRARLR